VHACNRGLVTTDTHLFQVLIRGIYEELPFPEWLRRIYHCGRALTAEDCYVSAMLGTLEAIKSGVTTLVDHHFLNGGEELPEATLDGMRAVGVRRIVARTTDGGPVAARPNAGPPRRFTVADAALGDDQRRACSASTILWAASNRANARTWRSWICTGRPTMSPCTTWCRT
jgi:cytosine/adenosine deaminase-related metal-dependent hydrolase